MLNTPNSAEALQRSWFARLELGQIMPTLLLAAVMVWCVFRSIADAGWAAGIDILPPIALAGLALGALFARLNWMPAWLAHPLSAMLGIALAVQQSAPALVSQVSREFGPNAAARLDSWPEQATEIVIRLLIWGRVLAAGGRGEDIVLFVVVLALLAWTVGYVAAWLLLRASYPWLVAAMTGGIFLINYTFALPKPDNLFFVFLGAALLLLVYQQVMQQQQLWRAVRIEFPDFLPWRFMAAAAVFCLVVIAGTALLPGQVTSAQAASAWRTIRQPFASAREAWNDAFSTINAPPGTSGSFVLRGVGVGGPRQLGQDVVMRVASERYEYWRAVAFDRYSGRQWQNTVGERARAVLGVATAEQARTPLDADVALDQTELLARTPVTQTVTLVQTRNDGVITFGGQFDRVSLPALVQHGYVERGGEQLPNFTELASVVTDLSLYETRSYTVTSYFSDADEQSLRRSGAVYPEWVPGPYLQLPQTLPARVRELAQQVVDEAGATSAYDKALAVQRYLRTLPYNEQRPAPPEDRDWVDYFLFDRRTGYCDDYASAMVVMLRSQGVPARWVQGYAGGTLDPNLEAYVVRENVAHSWVEVYFPGFGWQRFEPTPAPYASVPVRPAEPPAEANEDDTAAAEDTLGTSDTDELRRQLEEQQAEASDPAALEAARREIEAARARQRLVQLATAAAIIGALIAAAAAAWVALGWQLRGLSPAEAAYARLTRLAGWAGVPHEPNTTPLEYGEAIKRQTRAAREPVDRIVAAYTSTRYAPYGAAEAEPEALAAAVREVRPSLLRRMLGRLGGSVRA
jgi:transglutaminase-like putative cysteine protease